MAYQNIGQTDNSNKFVSVSSEGQTTELSFTAKTTQVTVAAGQKIPVVTDTISLVRQKDVSCPDSVCQTAYIGNNVKITFTAVRGDSEAFTDLIGETVRILSAWRQQYNADIGILPPLVATFAATP